MVKVYIAFNGYSRWILHYNVSIANYNIKSSKVEYIIEIGEISQITKYIYYEEILVIILMV